MIAEELKQKILVLLRQHFGGDLSSVVLFGSYAEERQTPYSDLDIFVVVNREFGDWRERRRIEVVLRREALSIGPVSPKVMSQGDVLSALENYNPLLLNILFSGLVLYDCGFIAEVKGRASRIMGGSVSRTHQGYWKVAA